jgi:hypothetical protein
LEQVSTQDVGAEERWSHNVRVPIRSIPQSAL